MNKGYQHNPTLAETHETVIKQIRDSSPVKEEAKTITPLKEKPCVTPVQAFHPHHPEHNTCSEQSERTEAQPYIDRGPSLPEHYADDTIIALTRDPRCIFTYWDLKGLKSQEAINHHKGPKSWFLRVHHSNEDAYHDVPINVDARNWYLQVTDNKNYIIDLGFSTQDGEFLPLASSNPVQTPRAGTSQEYIEYWGFIFRDTNKDKKHHLETHSSPESAAWASPGGRWYETLLETHHVPGSSTLHPQEKE